MFPQIRLRRDGDVALHDQLAATLRRLILSGELPPGTRLPATRRAAASLGVSRQIVVLAYEQLQLEGYLRAGVGAGTWVAESLASHLLPPRMAHAEGKRAPVRVPRLGARGKRLVQHGSPIDGSRPTLPLRPSATAAEFFPVKTWLQVSTRAWRKDVRSLVHYGAVQGYQLLREAIADHLIRHRGVRTTPDQIVVTSGTQQSLDVLARMLLDEGDAAGVEDPCYDGASCAFRAAGAELVPVPVDGSGMNPLAVFNRLRHVRLLYTTPSHQYPLGVTLELERRLALLECARRAGSWIVEDDYDSEFRFASRPLPSLQGLDGGERVIYLGTFSKVLAAGLRVAYLALPPNLVEAVVRVRQLTDNHPALPIQAALAEFMADGHLERHIARMRGVYGERRAALRDSLKEVLGREFEVIPGEAGLHLAMMLPARIDDVAVASAGFARGIDPQPISLHYVSTATRPGLLLGYGGTAPSLLRESVHVLYDCLQGTGRRATG